MRRALIVALAACVACPGWSERPPSAPGGPPPEMILALHERGGAALAGDARWLVVATWHAVTRVEKATGEVTALHVEPTGGIASSTVAMDGESVYFVVRRACRDDLARAAECAAIEMVGLEPSAAQSVLELARGDGAPHALAAGHRNLHFALRNRVMRVAKTGGAPEIVAEAEDRVRGLAVDGDRLYYNDARTLVTRAEGEPTRAVGHVDAEGEVPIGFDRASVYWIADGKVWRASKEGGVAEVLGEARSEDARLAADDVGLAWTEPHDQAIAVKRVGGQVARARLREARPDDIALDPRFVFASTIDANDGTTRIVRVMR
jgi:hypothetical protein